MSVRRLAEPHLQPASFTFSEDNLAWVRKQIAKFPLIFRDKGSRSSMNVFVQPDVLTIVRW